MASYCGDIRAADRSPSPVPRRRPLTPRARNQRSYSRKSPSRSAINDVQPLEFSPIPVFPKRRRSITFADEDEVFVREERPYCTEQERFETADGYGRSNGAAFWDAEGGAGAEKPAFEGHTAKNQRDGYRVDDVSALDKNVPSTPMLRSRSASRQRRALRRQEAEREFSFYNDSFVEGYVNKLAQNLERKKSANRSRQM
uniref:Uncharacterized protein TCIL3000_11_940 n=1 Tax=Trypanosoma congolense (strain IL3000) TaxID=1068625 RepID=G0UZ93_TRYCI|nr:unnamed protein product [Trypanosoma congolense IL3000]